jgi:DNA-binding NtrC family response regulator
VRELEGLIKNAIVMSEGDVLDDFEYPASAESGRASRGDASGGALGTELQDREREILKAALDRCRSTRELAAHLGISQPTVVRKLKKHGLSTAG